jgi:transposase
VIEMSQSNWLVAGIVPGVERQPLKKIAIDEHTLLKLLSRWQIEAEKKGHKITRVAVAFEAGHDGFWLARRLAAFGIEVHVIHASSVAVTREHRRAKTDRLDTELLKRGFLGWLRGERGHCKMVMVPTLAEEDAKRPSREREALVGEASRIITRLKAAFVRLVIRSFNPKLKTATERLGTLRTPEGEPIPPNTLAALKRDLERHNIIKRQIREIEQTRLDQLAQAPAKGLHPMVLLLARVVGIGVETADMLVHEVLSRNMRDRRAVARYAGLTGSPDESGAKRREKGLARSEAKSKGCSSVGANFLSAKDASPGRQRVRRHLLHCLRAEHAHAVEFAAIQKHLAEAEIVRRSRNEPAVAGEQLWRPSDIPDRRPFRHRGIDKAIELLLRY